MAGSKTGNKEYQGLLRWARRYRGAGKLHLGAKSWRADNWMSWVGFLDDGQGSTRLQEGMEGGCDPTKCIFTFQSRCLVAALHLWLSLSAIDSLLPTLATPGQWFIEARISTWWMILIRTFAFIHIQANPLSTDFTPDQERRRLQEIASHRFACSQLQMISYLITQARSSKRSEIRRADFYKAPVCQAMQVSFILPHSSSHPGKRILVNWSSTGTTTWLDGV